MLYRERIRTLLSPAEARVFSKLTTPQKIQDFLDKLPANELGEDEHTMRGPVEMLKAGRAHCMEGAMFAAAALAFHGHEALLMDLRSTNDDLDHVVALFKQNGLWGAISKTNHPVLRWRDPVYKSVRELAMSYFHEYFLYDGEKTLRAYSGAFNLKRFKAETWVTAVGDLDWLAEKLDDSHHFPIYPALQKKLLRPASHLEAVAAEAKEWPKKK